MPYTWRDASVAHHVGICYFIPEAQLPGLTDKYSQDGVVRCRAEALQNHLVGPLANDFEPEAVIQLAVRLRKLLIGIGGRTGTGPAGCIIPRIHLVLLHDEITHRRPLG